MNKDRKKNKKIMQELRTIEDLFVSIGKQIRDIEDELKDIRESIKENENVSELTPIQPEKIYTPPPQELVNPRRVEVSNYERRRDIDNLLEEKGY